MGAADEVEGCKHRVDGKNRISQISDGLAIKPLRTPSTLMKDEEWKKNKLYVRLGWEVKGAVINSVLAEPTIMWWNNGLGFKGFGVAVRVMIRLYNNNRP
jgi:hypothetical protein